MCLSTGTSCVIRSAGMGLPFTSHAEQKSQRALQSTNGTDKRHGKLFNSVAPVENSYLLSIRLSNNRSPLRCAFKSSGLQFRMLLTLNFGKGSGHNFSTMGSISGPDDEDGGDSVPTLSS